MVFMLGNSFLQQEERVLWGCVKNPVCNFPEVQSSKCKKWYNCEIINQPENGIIGCLCEALEKSLC